MLLWVSGRSVAQGSAANLHSPAAVTWVKPGALFDCFTTRQWLSAGNGKLEPPKSDAAARAAFLQWTVSAETGLTVGLMDVFWHTMQFPEEQRKPQIAERGREL